MHRQKKGRLSLAFNKIYATEVTQLNKDRIEDVIDKQKLEIFIETYRIVDTNPIAPEETQEKAIVSEKMVNLNNLINLTKASFFKDKHRNQVLQILTEVCTDKNGTVGLMNEYVIAFDKNLISDLTSMNNTVSNISENLRYFIDYNIVESNYPHKYIMR